MSTEAQRPRDSAINSTPLPEWMFDVSDNDNWGRESNDVLHELEISPHSIFQHILYVLYAPFNRKHIIEKEANTNPFANHLSDDHHHDFWGPCLIVSLYALILSFGRVNNVSWVFIIWLISSLIQHLTCRPWLHSSSPSLHIAISGYSVVPFIPISLIVVIFNLPIVLAQILTYIAIAWSSFAALKTHWHLCVTSPIEVKRNLVLLVLPIVLMEFYYSSLLPMIGWN